LPIGLSCRPLFVLFRQGRSFVAFCWEMGRPNLSSAYSSTVTSTCVLALSSEPHKME
jgi:hypothetical protein